MNNSGLISRDPITLLRYEAARKPLVASLVERAHLLTDGEINSAPVLKWIRQALHKLRDQRGLDALRVSLEAHIVDILLPDSQGLMYRWIGAETFLPFGGRTELLIPNGALLWLPRDSAGMWYETAYAPRIDDRLSHNVELIRPTSKTDYIAAYKARTAGVVVPADAATNRRTSHGIPGLVITHL